MSNDRTLAIIAGASIVVSVGAVLARLAGAMPDGVSTIVVLVSAAIVLKVALSYAARSALGRDTRHEPRLPARRSESGRP